MLHAILSNEESVSETEIQFMRSFCEPVTFLFRGIHKVEKILQKRSSLRVGGTNLCLTCRASFR